MLYQIVAMANNRVIGKENRLPWHYSSDLKAFKRLTLGSTIIMGRKTYESIGKPLPGRDNFILSRTTEPSSHGGVRFFSGLDDALEQVKTPDCFIIGGAKLYAETMDRVDAIWLTRINADFDGDAYYPEIPSSFEKIEKSVLQEEPKLELIRYEKRRV